MAHIEFSYIKYLLKQLPEQTNLFDGSLFVSNKKGGRLIEKLAVTKVFITSWEPHLREGLQLRDNYSNSSPRESRPKNIPNPTPLSSFCLTPPPPLPPHITAQ